MMKILYLCDKEIYTKKMSRVRFHSIDAIKRCPGIELKKSGPGWKGFVSADQVEREYNPDLVVWYKPLDMPGHKNVKAPKCLRYNEMWDIGWTKKEITESGSELVICHHFNDFEKYAGKLDPKYKLVHNPHCGEKSVFRDYKQGKPIDVMFVGVKSREFYPLRRKLLKRVVPLLQARGVNFRKYKHPGYRLEGESAINKQVRDYAQAINRAKIVITCSSKYKYALAKYVEVPLCRTALCGDIPEENQEWYRKWMIPISMDYNAEKICSIIMEVLGNPYKLKRLTELGYQENLKYRTQEEYARRFIMAAEYFLDGKMDSYDFGKDSMRYLNGGDG